MARKPTTLRGALTRDLGWSVPTGVLLGAAAAALIPEISWLPGLAVGALMGATVGFRVTFRHTWPQIRADRDLTDLRQASNRAPSRAGEDRVIEVRGEHVTGVVADYDRSRLLLAAGVVAVMLAFLTVMVLLAPMEDNGDGPTKRWVGLAGLLLLLPIAANLLADAIRGRRIGGTQQGLFYGRPGHELLVPWSSIEEAATFARRQPMLGISVSDGSSIHGSRLAVLARRLPAISTDHDLTFPLRPIDPDDVAPVLQMAKRYIPIELSPDASGRAQPAERSR